MRRTLVPVLLGLVALTPSAGLLAKAEVGSKAPRLEPKEWLNTEGRMSWSQLKGRVILVEKWATW